MSEPSPTRPRLGLRIGDGERRACADQLADGFMTGRLSREEFESRVDQSLAAVTDVDLALLTHDLHTETGREPVTRRTRTPTTVVSLSPAGVVKVVAFEVVLAVVALVVALGFGSGDWPLIAVFLWAFGSVTGGIGAALARSERPPAP